MTRPRRHLAALAIAAALAPAIGLADAPPPAGTKTLLEAGRRLYEAGVGADGGERTALVGPERTAVPAAVLPCASCHGEDGHGRPEGAVLPPDLTWRHLTRPDGHVHAERRHPPFDEAGLARAVTLGVDPAGQRLDFAMPRYALGPGDLAALLAWLQALEARRDPGVGEAVLRLGTVLPTGGPTGAAGEAVRQVLEARLAEVNAAGGLHGRRLELEVAGYDPAHEAGLVAAAGLLGREVLALVAPLTPGAEDGLAVRAEAAHVPVVGALGGPGAPPATATWTFRLEPGSSEAARVLVEHAGAWLPETGRRIAILVATAQPGAPAAAEAALDQARARGVAVVARVDAGPGGPTPDEVAHLRAAGAEAVLILADDGAFRAFLSAAGAAGWTPRVLAPAVLARGALEAPAGFEGRIRLAWPAAPGHLTAAGRAHLEALTPGAPPRLRPLQAAALASLEVLLEGLRRAGKSVGRTRLAQALEGLSGFETGLSPPVTFGPGRRLGVLGGHVAEARLAERTFRPVDAWVRLE